MFEGVILWVMWEQNKAPLHASSVRSEGAGPPCPERARLMIGRDTIRDSSSMIWFRCTEEAP